MNKKLFLITLALVVFFLALGTAGFILGKGSLSVTAPYGGADDNVKFRFDGSDYQTPKEIKGITPGKYTVTSEMTNAKPFKKTVDIKRWDKSTIVIDFEPINKEDESFRNKEDAVSTSPEKQQGTFEKSEPLTNHLPYFGDNFLFDYYTYEASDDGSETTKTVVIYFLKSNNYVGNLPAIKKWITQKGFDPSKIHVADGGPLNIQ